MPSGWNTQCSICSECHKHHQPEGSLHRLDGPNAADEATRVQALQDQINALNTTLEGITSGDLIPKTDLLAANPNLIDRQPLHP